VESALAHFFTESNLTSLRELALEEIAHRLDRRRNEKSGAENVGSSYRVMVCLSSRSPNAERLLRKGARLADRLSAPWYAVYVRTPSEEVPRIDAATQRHISNTLTLVQHLGGTPWEGKGGDFVSAAATFAKEYGITHVVMGRSRRPWYRRWFGQSLLDRLLSAVPDADVLVVGKS
jgi:two-component system sensor histidine kinase KdpD